MVLGLLSAGAFWSATAFFAGWVTGTPSLCSFGALGFLVFFGLGWLWVWSARVEEARWREALWLENDGARELWLDEAPFDWHHEDAA